jgi:glycosyltransferase involved in cell wall biosynthesis
MRAYGASPYRVAYVIGHLKIGGAEKHIYEVLRRLDRSRFTPQVYCLKRRGPIVQSLERLGIEVTDLEIGDRLSAPKSLFCLFKFAQHLRKERISLLHCYLPRASFFGAIAGKIARVPAVLVSKRSLEPQESLKQVFLCRVANAWADLVLANSQAVLRHAVEVGRCRPDKLRLLVNGIDIERYRNGSVNGLNYQAPVVGTVLRLEHIKGPAVFIEAAKRIVDEMPEARFLIIGDGSMRANLERLSGSLGIADRVQFLGERNDVDAILPSFSIFILPSLAEGMSMALLEAMAAARPIVATAVGGNLDLIRNGDNGLLVPPGDPEEMALTTIKLLKNPQWAERLGQTARTTVLSHHSANSMVRRLEEIYKELLQRKALNRSTRPLVNRKNHESLSGDPQ